MKMTNKRPKRFGVTWTKNITRILLIVGVAEATAPYILSAFGREPCETMGAAWVTEIVAVKRLALSRAAPGLKVFV